MFRYDPDPAPASRSGCVIHDYGSANPDPNEIFTDPQDWFGSISPLSSGKESHLCMYQSGYNLSLCLLVEGKACKFNMPD